MKLDKTIVFLFIPPVIAVILCIMIPFIIRETKALTPEQPEFLTYVDQLTVFTLKGDPGSAPSGIRDVFRHEWTLPQPDPLPDPVPITVSMIVEAGDNSYCIINGRKMQRGDKTAGFSVTSIGSDQVTITSNNGTREIHHVKAY
ncbi:MAG TPA: hypothetical protein VMU10_08025 [Desulfomonilia bacterium]|nr:hypothetical protein [Desulfomonilia bacterium]